MTLTLPVAAQVKQRLLPLSPIGAILEWLIERLPRRYISVALKPLSDLKAQSETTGAYLSLGNSPTFALETNSSWAEGWYYLEAALMRNSGSRHAQICYQLGAQADHAAPKAVTIPISSNLRGSVREVIYLPKGVRSIKWVPTQARGFFSQSPLLLHKISGFESGLRRWHRVLFDLWRFQQLQPSRRAGLTLGQALCDLQKAYTSSTLLRLQRLSGFDYASFVVQSEGQKHKRMPALLQQANIPQPVLISVVIALDQADEKVLQTCVASLQAQNYPHWELLLVGDCPEKSAMLDFVQRLCLVGQNIRQIRYLPSGNLPLADQLNRAVALAAGEYVLRIRPCDCLPTYALLYLALEVHQHPNAKLIYCDDDKLDSLTGERTAPRFRPDWNPELLLSHNYVGDWAAYSKDQLLAVGSYRNGYPEAEDYDLFLRASQACNAADIRHIPQVLCHRLRQESNGSSIEPGAQYHEAAKRALQDRLTASGAEVRDGPALGLYRIRHPLPKVLPLVSMIVPTRDRADLLEKCVSSVQQKTQYTNWEMLIVDNDSVEPATRDYLQSVQQDCRIRVLHYPGPFNYAAINNHAAKECRGQVLLLLNNDIEVISPDWLDELVSHAIRPGVGAVGAKLLYADGTVQHAGVIIGMGGVAGHVHKFIKGDAPGYCNRAVITQNLSAVTGACLAITKSRFFSVNGLDEKLAVAFNDVDLCLRLFKSGHRNVFTPWTLLYHHESLSRGVDDTPEKQAVFKYEFQFMQQRWGQMLEIDSGWNLFNLFGETNSWDSSPLKGIGLC